MINSLKGERETAVSVAVARAVAEVEAFYSSLMAEERGKHEKEIRYALETAREKYRDANERSPSLLVDMEAVLALSELQAKVTNC